MGLLNPPRNRSNAAPIAIIVVIFFAAIVALRWYAEEQPTQADGREQAEAAQVASETPLPTMTPRPTYNFVIDTVQAGQLEVIAQEKLNLAAQGTLTVEEANARLRYMQAEHEAKQTRESALHTFAITSTQAANMMSIQAKLTENETARQVAIEQHQLKLVIAIMIFAIGAGIVLAIVVEVGKRGLAVIDRLIAAWDAAGQPAPVELRALEIHRDGNIRRPLAGGICSDDELRIIARVAASEDGLTSRALEAAGLSSERWGDHKTQSGRLIPGIRSKMVHRGLVEITNPESARPRAEPTPDGEALFRKVLEMEAQ